MKKFIAVLVTLALLCTMVMAMAGCSQPEEPDDGKDPIVNPGDKTTIPDNIAGKKLTFMLICETATGTSGAQFVAGFNRQCNQLGIKPIVSDAAGSVDKMVAYLDAAVNQRVDAIVINNGRADALTTGVKKAIAAGITVITKDVDLQLEGVPTVDQDDYLLALLSVKQTVADINGQSNVVRGFAPGFVPQERRYEMSKLYLGRYPKIQQVAEFGPVSASTALDSQTKMEAILKQFPTKNGIAAVWCGWEEWAKGACKAIIEAGRASDIKVYSTDMSDELLQMLQDPANPYTATAAIDIPMMAEVCVEWLCASLGRNLYPNFYSFSGTLVKIRLAHRQRVTTAD